jgi:hypothetical protein
MRNLRYKIKTRPTHRSGPGELFIGTNNWFALMNSAPAELLQLLTFAALQPSSVPPCPILQLVAKSGVSRARRRTVFVAVNVPSAAPYSSKQKPPCLKNFKHGGRKKRCGLVHIRVNLYPDL